MHGRNRIERGAIRPGFVIAYLPHGSDIAQVLITWVVGAVLLLAGAGLTGGRLAPEFKIATGWGALCLLLTSWGIFVPLTLRIPACAFITAALAVLLLPRRRPAAGDWVALGRLLIISLPLWLVMAPIRPSQPDTFLNLLPNAFYLVDYGRLPTSALPPSFSLLPAAPYNTQFLSFLGALIDADYPSAGMSLINLMLQLLAALAISRLLGRSSALSGTAPGWGLIAAALLLVTLLNPGFVPRIHLAAYGESAFAAMALFAALLFVLAQGELTADRRPMQLIPLALVLAAIVNTKQAGLGLVASLAAAAAISVWAEQRARAAVAVTTIASAVLPAILLYTLWRYHVAHAGVDELKLLPFAQWNWAHLRETTSSAVTVISGKPLYFGCAVVAMLLLPLLWRSQGWTLTTRLLTFNAALFVLYNSFILITYIAAFPTEMSVEAHSYFRYNTHLSLLLVLSLALAIRDLGAAARLTRERLKFISGVVLVCAVIAPIAFVQRLRFDLDMPQPLVWNLAKNLRSYLRDGDRLALLLPGDNDSVATMISGVLAYTAPRRRMLDILRRDTADPSTLKEATRLGYQWAFISCTDESRDWAGGEAALLRQEPAGWEITATWPYPADAAKRRWQHILSWAPLCRTQ